MSTPTGNHFPALLVLQSGDDHVVDVHIANLRRKIGDDPKAPRYVLTVRGVGYRMGEAG